MKVERVNPGAVSHGQRSCFEPSKADGGEIGGPTCPVAASTFTQKTGSPGPTSVLVLRMHIHEWDPGVPLAGGGLTVAAVTMDETRQVAKSWGQGAEG